MPKSEVVLNDTFPSNAIEQPKQHSAPSHFATRIELDELKHCTALKTSRGLLFTRRYYVVRYNQGQKICRGKVSNACLRAYTLYRSNGFELISDIACLSFLLEALMSLAWTFRCLESLQIILSTHVIRQPTPQMALLASFDNAEAGRAIEQRRTGRESGVAF